MTSGTAYIARNAVLYYSILKAVYLVQMEIFINVNFFKYFYCYQLSNAAVYHTKLAINHPCVRASLIKNFLNIKLQQEEKAQKTPFKILRAQGYSFVKIRSSHKKSKIERND